MPPEAMKLADLVTIYDWNTGTVLHKSFNLNYKPVGAMKNDSLDWCKEENYYSTVR
jgi:hypothetical protein